MRHMNSAASPGWNSWKLSRVVLLVPPALRAVDHFLIRQKRLPRTGTISKPHSTIGYSLLRDLLRVLSQGPETEVTNVDVLPRLEAWAASLGLQGIEFLKSGLDQAYRLQIRNINQQLGFEALGLEVLGRAKDLSR